MVEHLTEKVTRVVSGYSNREANSAGSAGIPAAQYLRSSSDSQVYSIENQAKVIESYARLHGFEIMRTFEDPGRTGVTLQHRPGLRALLAEVMQGSARFKAILVYDVSRWGRFQNCDESGHYEFLCRQAGVEVHYCAEQFLNNGTVEHSVLKALKRAMAAEFSREHSRRVQNALRRTAEQGFKCSGTLRFGYRRLLVTASRNPIRLLAEGEFNGTPGQRVVYTLGPEPEVKCVRNMFKWAATGLSTASIAERLNQESITWHHDLPWNADRVRRTLRNPTYAGQVIFGKNVTFLHSAKIPQPAANWTVNDHIAPAIVGMRVFKKVQRLLERTLPRNPNLADRRIVAHLKKILTEKGRLSRQILADDSYLPSIYFLKRRFGSLRRLYKLVGFEKEGYFLVSQRRIGRAEIYRAELEALVATNPSRIQVSVRPRAKLRKQLCLDGKIAFSLRIARSIPSPKTVRCWRSEPVKQEANLPMLLCLLDAENCRVERRFLVPPCKTQGPINISTRFLAKCKRLESLEKFSDEAGAMLVFPSTSGH
jgi:DNA invertase Pin-like site-specific DNA recombinase